VFDTLSEYVQDFVLADYMLDLLEHIDLKGMIQPGAEGMEFIPASALCPSDAK
jgi:hypothetical protein